MFGHEMIPAFLIDPGVLHLNHGSYGALPRVVADEQTRLRAMAEARASSFNRETHYELLSDSLQSISGLLGGRSQDWVLTDNATAGCNIVLASLDLQPGDEVLFTSETYGAVQKGLHHWHGRRGVTLTRLPLRVPLEGPEVVTQTIKAALSARTKLVVLDHITSPTALIMPVEDIAAMCRKAGVPVLVDGAHVPGHLSVDVPALGVDYWVGNAHKWLFAPRSVAALWCAAKWQDRLRPPVVSHGSFEGFQQAFAWVGTRDASPWHAIPKAISTHKELGGTRLMQRNRALAAEAGDMLAEALGGRLAGPREMRGAMAAVSLRGLTGADPKKLQGDFARLYGIETGFFPFNDGVGLRVSAQIYNELTDYERLLTALKSHFDL